jgi:hypothetical protein
LSPAGGAEVHLDTFQWFRESSPWFLPGLGVVVVVKLVLAAMLFELAVRTFDRCLGRMPDSQDGRRNRPRTLATEPEPAATFPPT